MKTVTSLTGKINSIWSNLYRRPNFFDTKLIQHKNNTVLLGTNTDITNSITQASLVFQSNFTQKILKYRRICLFFPLLPLSIGVTLQHLDPIVLQPETMAILGLVSVLPTVAFFYTTRTFVAKMFLLDSSMPLLNRKLRIETLNPINAKTSTHLVKINNLRSTKSSFQNWAEIETQSNGMEKIIKKFAVETSAMKISPFQHADEICDIVKEQKLKE
ncbi:hypothetical protein HDU92_005008 [Lobulomyces angularis]|nr:hypothetical protein HDU92_005008 [Lobulomyces angularis]